MAVRGARRGVVAEFDDHAGLGTIRDHDGSSLPFHCTAIADGTRTIAAGTDVTFQIVPGRVGRWEATQVAPT